MFSLLSSSMITFAFWVGFCAPLPLRAAALSAATTGRFANIRPTPILQQIDPVTQTVLDGFHSIVEASSATGTPASTIFRAIHGAGDDSTAGGYHWRWCLEAKNPITRDVVAARRKAEICGVGIGKNPENRVAATASPEFALLRQDEEQGEAAFNVPSPSHEDKEAVISSIVHPKDCLVKILLSCLLGGGGLRSIVRWVIHRRSSASAGASCSDV